MTTGSGVPRKHAKEMPILLEQEAIASEKDSQNTIVLRHLCVS